ncbi:hypothetical protein D3C81_663990 [compost metagenome]
MVALSGALVALVILAQVVPVGRINHGFVLQLRVRAGHDAGHVELLDAADLAIELDLDRGVQGDRAERARFRLGAQGVQVLPARLEQGARHVFLQPAFHRIARASQAEAFMAKTVGRHRPGVRGRRGRVDQQHAGRALAQRFLVLVDPAAIPGERLAGKAVRLACGRLRVVDHHDHQLAFQVDALEVVPVFIGGGDAVAGKHDGRVERHFFLAIGGAKDDVLAEGGRERLAARAEGHRARWQGLAADDGQRLAVRAILQWLQAGHGRLRFQVAHGQVAAALARAAPFEQVIGQEGQVGAQRRFGDDGLGEGSRAEHAGGEDEGETHDNSKSEYRKAKQGQSYSTAKAWA